MAKSKNKPKKNDIVVDLKKIDPTTIEKVTKYLSTLKRTVDKYEQAVFYLLQCKDLMFERVEFVIEVVAHKFRCLMGNHDWKYSKWYINDDGIKIKVYRCKWCWAKTTRNK